MPQIESIQLNVQTGKDSGAGTDGAVYLGLCGREFRIDSTSDDFKRESGREYVFGNGATVKNAEFNDPRKQTLFTEDVTRYPVYVRFEPKSGSDNWQLQRAEVQFNGSGHIEWDTIATIPNDPAKGIWLGIRSGLFAHLENHLDNPPLP